MLGLLEGLGIQCKQNRKNSLPAWKLPFQGNVTFSPISFKIDESF